MIGEAEIATKIMAVVIIPKFIFKDFEMLKMMIWSDVTHQLILHLIGHNNHKHLPEIVKGKNVVKFSIID